MWANDPKLKQSNGPPLPSCVDMHDGTSLGNPVLNYN